MSAAERRCSCGAPLEEAGSELRCPGCGARARSWLVSFRGELVAAGGRGEVYIASDFLREGLGLRQATLDAAAAPDFKPARRETGDTVAMPEVGLTAPRRSGRRWVG